MSRIDDLIREHCPDGVEFRRLGDVIAVRFGGRITKLKDSGSLYPVFGGGGESFRTDNFNREDEWVISRFAMSEICVRRVPGRFWMLDSGFTFDPATSEILKDYVAYWLLNAQPAIYACSSQGAQKNLRTKEFLNFRIPVPPIEVQREIVRVLDSFQSLEARRRQYAHYRAALLRFDTAGHGATLEPLSDVAHLVNGKAHERVVDPDGEILLMTSKFISTQGVSARRVPRADVLTPAYMDQIALVMSDLPNGRALARAFFVDADDCYAANQRVCLLQTRDPALLLPRFLFYVLDRNPQLLRYDSGVDQTHLKKGDILGIEVPVPPLSEQERIVAILDKFDALVNDLSVGLPAELAARRKQYEYYRDRLLTFEEAA